MAAAAQPVDYSQWQRRTTDKNKSNPARASRKAADRRQPATGAAAAAASGYDTFSISSGQLSRIGSACSLSKCQHPWNNFRAMEAARNAREKKRARMKELNVSIQLHEKTLTEIKQREAEILKSNMELFASIESDEAASADQANSALAKYEKSRDTISVMRLRFDRQRRELAMEVADLKKRLDSSIGKLKSDVSKVTAEVKDIYEELALLNNYKDKVYPERLIFIHQLKQKLADQQLNNEEEESYLLEVIQTEHRNLVNNDRDAMEAMKANIANEAMSEMHPSLVSMANENQKLANDVEFHRLMNEQLQQDIKRLQAEILELSSDSQSSVVKTMFPQIFRDHADTCSPETEMTLDIPIRKLPVI